MIELTPEVLPFFVLNYESDYPDDTKPGIDKLIEEFYGRPYSSQMKGLRWGSPWWEGPWNNDTDWYVDLSDKEDLLDKFHEPWYYENPTKRNPRIPSITDSPTVDGDPIQRWIDRPIIPKDEKGFPFCSFRDEYMPYAPEVDYLMGDMVMKGALPFGHYLIRCSW